MKLLKQTVVGLVVAGALGWELFLGGVAIAGVILGIVAGRQSENLTLLLVLLGGVIGASLGIGISKFPVSALISGDLFLLVATSAMILAMPLFAAFLLTRAIRLLRHSL